MNNIERLSLSDNSICDVMPFSGFFYFYFYFNSNSMRFDEDNFPKYPDRLIARVAHKYSLFYSQLYDPNHLPPAAKKTAIGAPTFGIDPLEKDYHDRRYHLLLDMPIPSYNAEFACLRASLLSRKQKAKGFQAPDFFN